MDFIKYIMILNLDEIYKIYSDVIIINIYIYRIYNKYIKI